MPSRAASLEPARPAKANPNLLGERPLQAGESVAEEPANPQLDLQRPTGYWGIAQPAQVARVNPR
jgi:hypothetical protein